MNNYLIFLVNIFIYDRVMIYVFIICIYMYVESVDVKIVFGTLNVVLD